MFYDALIAPFLEFEFMRRALAAVVALSLGAAPIGVFLMLRRMSLVGDAMAHAILPGAAVGFLLSGLNLFAMTAGGLIAGFAVAILAGVVARTTELKDWSDIKLLSVAVDRLRHWSRDGLLCIGDSAHAMSPIGGVGINLAIQDAVAAANILVPALSKGASADAYLHKVQARREFPTRTTQGFQIFAHKRFITPALAAKAPLKRLPLPLALLKHFPILRRIPARMVGLGFRPEHIHTPDIHPRSNASARK